MNAHQHPSVYAPPTIAPVEHTQANTRPYPAFKVGLSYAAAPAMVGVAIILFFMVVALQPEFIVAGPMVVIAAEILFGLPALIAGLIISTCRWQKNAGDILKATLTGALCAGLPTAFMSVGAAFIMAAVAATISLILACIVLPTAESLAMPLQQHDKAAFDALLNDISAADEIDTPNVYHLNTQGQKKSV